MATPNNGRGSMEGWNDPPMFSYNPQAGGGYSQRTRLNKRVGYPQAPNNTTNLTGVSGSDSASGVLLNPTDGPPKLPPVQILPPTTSTNIHPPVPLLVPKMSPPIDPSALPPSFASAGKDPQLSQTLPELMERLQLESADSLRKYTKRILHETLDNLKDSIQGRSREDVQRRLGVLDDQWRDEKITEGAKVKLGCIASAIVNNDMKQADALHLSLMVDHISEVSQWMVAVKRLINELKLSKAALSISTVEKKTSSDAAQDVCLDTETLKKADTLLLSPDPNSSVHEKQECTLNESDSESKTEGASLSTPSSEKSPPSS